MRRKDKALDLWKQAIMLNPGNTQAVNNYRQHANKYDEPLSVHPLIEDLFHFQKLQVEKYLKEKGQI